MRELESVVHSNDFQKKMKQKDFKKTDEYQEFQSLKKLYKQSDIKFAIKTLNSSDYRIYDAVRKSPRLQEFMELDDYVNSSEFVATKEFYNDKDRFKKSEEYKLLHEYNELKASHEYKWFIKTKANYPFTEIDKWELVFEDDFDHSKLDANNWMTGYYWGKALLNDNYVLKNEKQFFTDKNIELRDSLLKITSKKEAYQGKVWDPEMGFLPAKFEYTSGLISTGHSFRQQYGKYDVKFRLQPGQHLNHSIWLLGERMIPQITVLKSNGKSVKAFEAGTIAGSIQKPEAKLQKLNGPSLADDFHILTLEWLPGKITWYINGVKLGEQTSNIPNEPMYLIFSSHITDTMPDHQLPSSIEVDWVKCYKVL
ncbi:MAG: glycoside hydrolase family 16 protein [Breznakibacter sp.]